MSTLTVEALADAIASIEHWRAGPDTLAGELLPFIERHIAAGQQGAVRKIDRKDAPETCTGWAENTDELTPGERDAYAWGWNNCLATPKPPKPAGAVPLPERHIVNIRTNDYGHKYIKTTEDPDGCFVYYDDAIRYGDAREAAAQDDQAASALAWMRKTAESLGTSTAGDGDGVFFLARGLTDWIDTARREAAGRADAVPDLQGWRVVPFTGSFKRGDECWEVYSPNGSGGGIDKNDVPWPLAGLLDMLAAAPLPQQPAAVNQPMTTQGERSAFQMVEEQEAAKGEGAGREAVAPFGHVMFTAAGKVADFSRYVPDGSYVFTVADFIKRDREFPADAPHTGMLVYTHSSPVAAPVVKALAAKCGVYYGNGKVDLGAPLYAFTPIELLAFSRRLQTTIFTPQ